MVKNLPANAGDVRNEGSIPGLGKFPGGVHGNQFQYFCLENCMERGAWQASLWGYKESDRTEGLTQNHLLLLVVVQSLSHV